MFPYLLFVFLSFSLFCLPRLLVKGRSGGVGKFQGLHVVVKVRVANFFCRIQLIYTGYFFFLSFLNNRGFFPGCLSKQNNYLVSLGTTKLHLNLKSTTLNPQHKNRIKVGMGSSKCALLLGFSIVVKIFYFQWAHCKLL